MVNMMESSLAESMVPNANNIYDPMVSSLTRHPGPGSLMCRVSAGDKLLCFTLCSHRAQKCTLRVSEKTCKNIFISNTRNDECYLNTYIPIRTISEQGRNCFKHRI